MFSLFLAGLALAALVVWGPAPVAVWQQISAVSPTVWMLATTGLAASYCLRALRLHAEWHALIGVSWPECLRVAVFHTVAINLLPMRSGEASYPLMLKQRWGISAAALAYRFNKVGYLTDWHYKSIVIEMRRRKYHELEPNPVPREVSYVHDLSLRALREKGISLRKIEADTRLPHAEIVGLLQGLAHVAISELDSLSPSERRASLRVVS